MHWSFVSYASKIISERFNVWTELPASNQSVLKYYYRKGDYEAMNEYLGSIGWSEILSSSIHDNWHVFKEIVQDAMTKHIPTLLQRETT